MNKIKKILLVLVIGLFLLPYSFALASSQEYDYDMGVSTEGIWFYPEEFFAGDQVRVYARIENYGRKDVRGKISFFQGIHQVGELNDLAIVAGGYPEEVWVDWIAPEGMVNMRVVIVDAYPEDENWSNNEAVSRTFEVFAREEEEEEIFIEEVEYEVVEFFDPLPNILPPAETDDSIGNPEPFRAQVQEAVNDILTTQNNIEEIDDNFDEEFLEEELESDAELDISEEVILEEAKEPTKDLNSSDWRRNILFSLLVIISLALLALFSRELLRK